MDRENLVSVDALSVDDRVSCIKEEISMPALVIRLDDITPDMNWDNFEAVKAILILSP